MRRLSPWIIILVIALTALGWYRRGTLDVQMLLPALFCIGAIVAHLYLSPILRKRWEKEWEQRTQAAIGRECNFLEESEGQIRRNLAAGKLRYLVEWWEDDALEIDENHHLLFIYADDTAHDFLLYQAVESKCVSLLSEYGIPWEPGFKLTFDSNILYPPALRGQKFYTPDGSTRKDLWP